MELKVASVEDLPTIYGAVHDVWPHDPDLDEHIRQRLASAKHQFARWYMLTEGGELKSSLGMFPTQFWVKGDVKEGFGIGSVHTPPAQRGNGYCSQMMKLVLDELAKEGRGIGVLYSDIAPEFYRRLGFHICPGAEFSEVVSEFTGVAEAAFEPVSPSAYRSIYKQNLGTLDLGIERSEEYWAWLERRSPLSHTMRLKGAGGDLAYAWLKVDGESLLVLDLLVIDPHQSTLIRGALLSWAQSKHVKKVEGWLPQALVGSQVWNQTERSKAITMTFGILPEDHKVQEFHMNDHV